MVNNPAKPSAPPLTNVVTVLTADDEGTCNQLSDANWKLNNILHIISYTEFPVKRRLLRPCIALTSVVQAGRGKYQSDSINDGDSSNESICPVIKVDVGACTFDRVLLYLEHEAREETFKFDPLIAPELLAAAETLNIVGLQESCQKVLGSFKVCCVKIYLYMSCMAFISPCRYV